MIARLRRRRSRRPDTGASAVEFALLAPVLFLILFGIIDYGIWFADAISLRQAVRDACASGSVENFGTSCSATVTDRDLHKFACSVASGAAPISGTVAVRAVIATDPQAASGRPHGSRASPCGSARSASTRLCCRWCRSRAGGISKTRVDIPIEQASSAGAATRTGYAGDPPPSGADWSWCP